jgi:hypothetical protein
MGVDPTTHKIYLPTAEFEDPNPEAGGDEAWHIRDRRGRTSRCEVDCQLIASVSDC